MTFTVYELIECIRWETWKHTVEADSLEEAIEKARDGDSESQDRIDDGNADYGDSGFGATIDEAHNDFLGISDEYMVDEGGGT